MNKKILTLIMVGLVGLPMAAAASTLQDQGVVTGHTTYANMGGFDENIAAIAGLAESKVVWFNGQTIFSSLGEGYVYAVKGGGCDPIDGVNYVFQDYNMSFIDPNNQSHIVGHYTYQCESASQESDPVDRIFGTAGMPATHHVWITLTHAKLRDGPLTIKGDPAPGSDDGRWYNFALAVDTKKIGDRGTEDHSGRGGRSSEEINSGDSYCETDGQYGDHVCNEGSVEGEDTPHEHNTATVDLYFSKRDRGIGAAASGGNHTGTQAGCSFDAYCNAVMTGTYSDPTASTA